MSLTAPQSLRTDHVAIRHDGETVAQAKLNDRLFVVARAIGGRYLGDLKNDGALAPAARVVKSASAALDAGADPNARTAKNYDCLELMLGGSGDLDDFGMGVAKLLIVRGFNLVDSPGFGRLITHGLDHQPESGGAVVVIHRDLAGLMLYVGKRAQGGLHTLGADGGTVLHRLAQDRPALLDALLSNHLINNAGGAEAIAAIVSHSGETAAHRLWRPDQLRDGREARGWRWGATAELVAMGVDLEADDANGVSVMDRIAVAVEQGLTTPPGVRSRDAEYRRAFAADIERRLLERNTSVPAHDGSGRGGMRL